MKKRIKYSNKIGLTFSEPVLTNHGFLYIEIRYINEKYYYDIKYASTGKAIDENKYASSVTKAKKLAKAKLVEYGALFGDEVRGKVVI